MTPLTSIDDVLALFDTHGDDRYDEELSQRDHALQTAALALAAGADDSLVVAALLHDVGHLLDLAAGGTADTPRLARHEQVGATALSALFDESVTAPIELHVEAKRYLTAVDPKSIDRLSNGSRASLVRQGGPMDEAEVVRSAPDGGSPRPVRCVVGTTTERSTVSSCHRCRPTGPPSSGWRGLSRSASRALAVRRTRCSARRTRSAAGA